jgi:hypothetical protein
MYEWIDRHEQKLGIGRPYLKGDPPHVAPLDGEEYVIHRIAGARGELPRGSRPGKASRRTTSCGCRADRRRGSISQ